MTRHEAMELILSELNKAHEKCPVWPDDKIHAAAILAEESGELIQETIDYEYKYKNNSIVPLKFESIERMKYEAAQCGAMAIRFLMNL